MSRESRGVEFASSFLMATESENTSIDGTVCVSNGRRNTSKNKKLSSLSSSAAHQPITLGICLNACKNEKKKTYMIK